jgi:hypothetical protein
MEMLPKVRSVTVVSLRNVDFCPQLLLVGFMVEGMSVEQAFLRVCSGFPLLITSPSLLPANIHSRQGSTVSLLPSCRSNYDVAIYVILC